MSMWHGCVNLPLIFFSKSTTNNSPVNEDSEAIEEVLNMLCIMFITALEMLHESNLLGNTTPLPYNVGIMTLLFLNFMTSTCSDFELKWLHEIVRAADTYDVVLVIPEPKRIAISQEQLDGLRVKCAKRGMMKGLNWKTRVSRPAFF